MSARLCAACLLGALDESGSCGHCGAGTNWGPANWYYDCDCGKRHFAHLKEPPGTLFRKCLCSRPAKGWMPIARPAASENPADVLERCTISALHAASEAKPQKEKAVKTVDRYAPASAPAHPYNKDCTCDKCSSVITQSAMSQAVQSELMRLRDSDNITIPVYYLRHLLTLNSILARWHEEAKQLRRDNERLKPASSAPPIVQIVDDLLYIDGVRMADCSSCGATTRWGDMFDDVCADCATRGDPSRCAQTYEIRTAD